MGNIHTYTHTHTYTALRQAGGISLLLIIIMKRLHAEYLPLRTQHDSRSVPALHTQAHTHAHISLFFLKFSSSFSSTSSNIYQTTMDPTGHSPSSPSPPGWAGVWWIPVWSAGLHCSLFSPKQTDGKRERDRQSVVPSWDSAQYGNRDLVKHLVPSSLSSIFTVYL